MAAKKNALVPMDSFTIAKRYEGMDSELLAELQDELADLDDERGITCRMIKIPAGGGVAYEVQGDDDDEVDYKKEIVGVIVFTHRMNGYWPGGFGSGEAEDKIPFCSSMDGKTGLTRENGELHNCDACPMNQFGTASDSKGAQAKGKACKNMRRLYLMMDNDPNVYLLAVPPTSIREVNRQLAQIMGSKGIPYTSLIVSLRLEKAINAGGIAYSKVVIEKKGLLPAAAASDAKEMRRQIKTQYQSLAVTLDDYGVFPDSAGSVDGIPAPARKGLERTGSALTAALDRFGIGGQDQVTPELLQEMMNDLGDPAEQDATA
jgi:hypothetical protein